MIYRPDPESFVADALTGTGHVSKMHWFIRWQYRRWLQGERKDLPNFVTVSLIDERDLLVELFRRGIESVTPDTLLW